MAREWTDEQKDAINARGALLVSAAAGSGKTAVLVERVIRRICDEKDPIDLDRMLIVTFTNAAANEMKERIGEAIGEKLKNDPDNVFLQRQQSLLNRANISTIDSFCKNLVREYFYLLDISSDFRIADAGELDILKAEALDCTLNRLYNSKNRDFYLFAEAFSTSKNDSELEKIILRIYEFLCSHPFRKKWIKKMIANYDADVEVFSTVWGQTVYDYTMGAIKYSLSLYEKSISLMRESESIFTERLSDHLNFCYSTLSGVLEKLSGVHSENSWDSVRKSILNAKIPNFPKMNGYTDHPTKISIHGNHSAAAETVKKLKELYSFDSMQISSQLTKLRPVIEQIFTCVSDFSDEFSKRKREKNLADFNDLERWALMLLTKETDDSYKLSELSVQISERFDEVMVDEYQDTNELQDTIFRALSGDNRRLFVVGDVKQSIYGFRQAMPEIFIERRRSCARYSRDNEAFPAAVTLSRNFRSRPEITDTVNFIFRLLMSKEVGNIDYNTDEELKSGAKYPSADSVCVDFMLIDSNKCGHDDSITSEACAVAEKILRMKHEGYEVNDNGTIRPLMFGDIAVLMRNLKGFAQIYVSVFNAYGIPVTCEKNENFFEIHEVRALINMLRIISNPLLDIPLLAVMMSPLYGFTSDDIAKIRILSRGGSLYASLLIAADSDLDCRMRVREFLTQISELRACSSTMGIHELITHIFETTGFSYVINAGKEAGGRKNLEKFCEYAANYEKNGRHGLSAFIGYMDNLSKRSSHIYGAADTHLADANTVNIISIHKSKGLEYPVCILANASKTFNLTDTREKVLIDSRMGVAAKLRVLEPSSYQPTHMHKALALELNRGLKSEELRLLYVALTRAKEKLIIAVSLKNIEKALVNASSKIIDSKIPPFNVQQADKYSTWLLMCALLHPDAHALRKLAGIDDRNIEFSNAPTWNFEIINETVGSEKFREELSDNEYSISSEEDLLTALKESCKFKYPLKAIENLPVKVTASEIAHKNISQIFGVTLSVPSFAKKEKMTAAQKGTAVHKFLQLCDFEKARTDINNEIERLVSCSKLSLAEADAVREKDPSGFFSSPLALEASESPEVYREYTFMVSIDAKFVDPEIEPPFDKRQVLMQGSVDLAFVRKDGSLLIADYKTDRIGKIEDLVERYAVQLALYSNAMEQSTGLTVSKCVLYSVHLGESIEVKV